jgi:hypothetical protein
MTLRTVVHDGTQWTVWDVVRSLDIALVPLPESASAQWLCFQSATEKRRISPAPAGWSTWSDEALIRALCAAPVVQATGFVRSRPDSAESAHARDQRFAGSMERARILGERVSRAMAEGGAKALGGDPGESGDPLPLPEPG